MLKREVVKDERRSLGCLGVLDDVFYGCCVGRGCPTPRGIKARAWQAHPTYLRGQ